MKTLNVIANNCCRILFMLLIVSNSAGVQAQYVTIPDENFAAALQKYGCMNGNQLNTELAAGITSIDCSNSHVSYIWGIQYFTNLQYFDCSNNQILNLHDTSNTQLLLPISLQYLNCSRNYFYQVYYAPYANYPFLDTFEASELKNLTYLDCSFDEIQPQILYIPNNVTYLNASANQFTTLGSALPARLIHLDLSFNQLPFLDTVSFPPNLIYLNIGSTQMATYYNTFPPGLDTLIASYDSFEVITNLPETITYVDISHNIKLNRFTPTHIHYLIFDTTNISCFVSYGSVDSSYPIITSYSLCQNSITIPDTNFVTWLNANGYSGCLVGNQMDTTCAMESPLITWPNLNISHQNIADFTGLQYLTNNATTSTGSFPRVFDLSYNNLQSFPTQLYGMINIEYSSAFSSNYVELKLSHNHIDSIYLDKSHFQFFDTLDLSYNGLVSIKADSVDPIYFFTALNLNNNNLTSYPTINSTAQIYELEGYAQSYALYIRHNKLTSLARCNFNYLDCGDNQLTTYVQDGLPYNTPWIILHLDSNNITSISISSYYLIGISYLDCSYNQLTSLDFDTFNLHNNNLQELVCSHNPLKSISSFPTGLATLNCSYDSLTALPALPPVITTLNCSNNPIQCLPPLTTIDTLNFSSTNVACIPNKGNVTVSTPLLSSLPICAPLTSCSLVKYSDTITQSICSGQSYDGHTANGTYVDTFVLASGYDSVRTLNLTINQLIKDTVSQTICGNAAYDGHTTSGTYVDTFTLPGGCDSIRTLFLTVNPTITPSVTINASQDTVCFGTKYVTLTSKVTNGGNSPVYRWVTTPSLVLEDTVSYDSIYVDSSLELGGNVVGLLVTSSLECGVSDSAGISVMVDVTPEVVALSDTGNVCNGTSLLQLNIEGSNASVSQINWQSGNTKIDSTQPVIQTVAGGNGSGSSANQLNSPNGIFVDRKGNIFVIDNNNNRIQEWKLGATTGITVAGGNGAGNNANQLNLMGIDGPGTMEIYVDTADNIYIPDCLNNRIQKWAAGATEGITIAGGNGEGGDSNQTSEPTGVFVDDSGNLYVAALAYNTIQKWAPGATYGVTVAGIFAWYGATDTTLYFPTEIVVDHQGNLYVADNYDNRIQKFTPGNIHGTTVIDYSTIIDNYPVAGIKSVYVDSMGNVFANDPLNQRVVKWSQLNSSGITVAGGNGTGNSTNQLNYPYGIYIDAAQNVYVADNKNNRVQKWSPNGGINTTISPNSAGTYSAIVTDYDGCFSISNSITIGNVEDTVSKAICSGTSYYGHATSGIYIDTLTSSGGCDSIRTLNLTVTTQIVDTISETIPSGQSYDGHTTSGEYIDTFMASGGCDSIQVLYLTVTPNDSLVWPGDANNDGIANLYDVLYIGIAYGNTGPQRPDATNQWIGQPCPDWLLLFQNGLNLKYADCNGDGVINANDTLPVLLNYGMTHNKTGAPRSPGSPPVLIQLTNAPVAAGDTAKFNIVLGDSTIPVNDIYGVAFSVNYNTNLFDANSFTTQFFNSWMGILDSNLLTFSKNLPLEGQLDLAATRTNHSNCSGSGVIGGISVITIDNISGKDQDMLQTIINITGVKANDSVGNPVILDPIPDTVDIAAGINNIQFNQPSLQLFPNPASGSINVVSDQFMQSYTANDITGTEVTRKENILSKQTAIDVSNYASGIYLLQVVIDGEKITKRFAVIH